MSAGWPAKETRTSYVDCVDCVGYVGYVGYVGAGLPRDSEAEADIAIAGQARSHAVRFHAVRSHAPSDKGPPTRGRISG